MHEGAIAAALIQSALELREQENFSSIKTLTVLIGRLHHVVPEVLQNHYRILKKEHPPLSRSKLVIEIAPLRITCRACGRETPIERPTFACSSC
ncbi:MAG: hydrogenase maturation nickel metallochaperone HypA, partial [Candidatus Aminicenantes bacterium]|nr:hydrogenase maturation nickel metallochaperone HypA [Candidatus Aminicenantes bacterium]